MPVYRDELAAARERELLLRRALERSERERDALARGRSPAPRSVPWRAALATLAVLAVPAALATGAFASSGALPVMARATEIAVGARPASPPAVIPAIPEEPAVEPASAAALAPGGDSVVLHHWTAEVERSFDAAVPVGTPCTLYLLSGDAHGGLVRIDCGGVRLLFTSVDTGQGRRDRSCRFAAGELACRPRIDNAETGCWVSTLERFVTCNREIDLRITSGLRDGPA